MPKRVPQDELDAVIRAVERHNGDGSSLSDILAAMDVPLPRSLVQRRLGQLVRAGVLVTEGRKRGTRYRTSARRPGGLVTAVATPPQPASQAREAHIDLSQTGAELRGQVRRPLHLRMPTGYRREWLDSYLPNQTAYLSEAERAHLRQLGARPDGERPAGTYARDILERLLIDLSWNSSRLEGNTYSELDTERLLEFGEPAEGKTSVDAQMILNHKDAIEFIVEEAEEVTLDRSSILNLHALLSQNLMGDPSASGRLRKKRVSISHSSYHPVEVPQLIDELFGQLLATARSIEDPFEQSFFTMMHLAYLQPFEDVNKRTSRIAANIPLVRANLCPLSFVEVPVKAYTEGLLAVYELQRHELLRDVFVWAYERSAAKYGVVKDSVVQPDPFRLRYHVLTKEIVADVVRKRLDPKSASSFVETWAQTRVDPRDIPRFVGMIEGELNALHEGNLARFRLRPSEFESWRQAWR